MPDYTMQDIRNVALVGHGSTGKTVLAEAMLYRAGTIGAMGTRLFTNFVDGYPPPSPWTAFRSPVSRR